MNVQHTPLFDALETRKTTTLHTITIMRKRGKEAKPDTDFRKEVIIRTTKTKKAENTFALWNAHIQDPYYLICETKKINLK